MIKKLVAGTIALPVLHFVHASEFETDNAVALFSCLSRTLRALDWAVRAGLEYSSWHRSADVDELERLNCYWAECLTDVCRENGGVYVKAAQMLSTFGAVPEAYRVRLGRLTDKCDPKPYGEIERSLRRELPSIDDMIDEIDKEATAAASIAQVHKAKLRSGERVALKIQYPTLRKSVSADLNVLIFLSTISDFVFPNYKTKWMFKQLKEMIAKETDFLIEAKNCLRLRDQLRHRSDLRVPELHMELCTSQLLVMEWIDGLKITDKEGLKSMGVNLRRLALTLIDVFAEMSLQQGFTHGDPHPGNLLVLPYTRETWIGWIRRILECRWGTPFQLVILDHGFYLEIDQTTRREYCRLWCALISGDRQTAVDSATRLCRGEFCGSILPRVLYRQFERTQRQLRSESTMADLMEAMRTAPQAVTDSLKISAVVRHVAAFLSDVKRDRVLIEGSRAWRGLSDSLSWRLSVRLRLRLLSMRLSMWWRDLFFGWQQL